MIWQIPEAFWENDWIRDLFAHVDYEEIMDCNFAEVRDRAIIITDHPDKLGRYLKRFEQRGYSFGIVHLSDEMVQHPKDSYDNASFVLRNYWDKKFVGIPNVKCIPLGYKCGFWNNSNYASVRETRDRKYVWSFIGQISKSTRQEMISNMKRIPQHFFYEIQTFADPNSLPVEQYREILLNSIFVPCPRGWWNLDSFRVYEALECGCIPIVEKQPIDYFTKFLGDHPFLSVSSWNEVPLLIEDLIKNPSELEKQRKACFDWWMEYKRHLREEIAETVSNGFQK